MECIIRYTKNVSILIQASELFFAGNRHLLVSVIYSQLCRS